MSRIIKTDSKRHTKQNMNAVLSLFLIKYTRTSDSTKHLQCLIFSFCVKPKGKVMKVCTGAESEIRAVKMCSCTCG